MLSWQRRSEDEPVAGSWQPLARSFIMGCVLTNADVAATFEKIAMILRLQNANPFRVRAYDRAAQTIAGLTDDLLTLYEAGGRDALLEIPGIGQDLADKIVEMVTTGTLAYMAELEKKIPKGLFDIMEIAGVGPKKTQLLYKKFHVRSIGDLQKLLKTGKLQTVKGWGEKSVENILVGIAARRAHSSLTALPKAAAVAETLKAALIESGLCTRVEIAGSVRRRKDMIGDIDILAASTTPARVTDLFCAFEDVARVLAKGPTKSSVRLHSGVQADLRVVDSNVFGAALHYFTGSKDHNVHIRQLGIRRGCTISEYGVYRGTAARKGKLLASRTEEDIYRAVGLPYIEPELREDRGEIEAAFAGKLPDLIGQGDIRGDLHVHSKFSDGSATMIEMAKAAKASGLAYIAMTDHASPMGMVFGLKQKNIGEYLKQIDEAKKAVPGMHILAGVEVDILRDGSLYLPDSILEQLDWVVASVHGNFKMSSAAMTERILRAVEHPLVDVIAHPTARLLLKRDPIAFDMDAVLRSAATHNVAMEINASIYRLDLNDVHAKRAKDLGCLLTIDSDAHGPGEFDYRFGVSQARRAWVERGDVLNTKTWKEFEKWQRS